MKRALALSICCWLQPFAAVAEVEPLAGSQYKLLQIEAATLPQPANRYRVTAAPATAMAGGFHLRGAGVHKLGGGTCGPADAVFANSFEN